MAKLETRFLPSRDAWGFPNKFWRGFCGGMCYGALDHFHAGTAIPKGDILPETGTGLWLYIFRRQLQSMASFGIKVYNWQRMQDADAGGEPGLGTRTMAELARLREELTAGRPTVLCLIRARGGISAVSKNHQVVAYAMDEGPDAAVIRVYDPNSPKKDTATLTVPLKSPEKGITIRQSNASKSPSRGFFVVNYSSAKPPRFA